MTGFTLPGIAQALGGEPKRNQYVMAPGPQHSLADRSLKVWLDETGRVCCSTYSIADSWADCMDYVRSRLGIPPFEPGRRDKAHYRLSPEDRLGEAIGSWQSTVDDHRADDRMAARIWAEAVNPAGTLAEAYLAGRHLQLLGDVPMRTVRFHPACPRGDERFPALLVRFTPIVHPAEAVPWDGDPPVTCIQRIFLDPSKPKGHDGKWLMGHPFDLPRPELREGQVYMPPSRSILTMKLSSDEEVEEGLFLTEGFESGLAAMHLGFRPLWAVYSAKAIEMFPVFGGISALTVMADHDGRKNGRADGAGQLAARTCRRRWRKTGVAIYIPETVGDDWADTLVRHCNAPI